MRTAFLCAVGGLLIVAGNCLAPGGPCFPFDWRALFLVMLYTSILVVARYSPGGLLYRVLVLRRPDRHMALEIRQAREMLVFAGTRILFAGLIFTLVDVANVLATNDDLILAAGTLSGALRASLYSLVLYVIISRAAERALTSARRQAPLGG